MSSSTVFGSSGEDEPEVDDKAREKTTSDNTAATVQEERTALAWREVERCWSRKDKFTCSQWERS